MEVGRLSSESFRELRRRYLAPVLVLLQGLRWATNLLWLACLIPFAMDITFPEGSVVMRARDAAMGGQVYQDWREWPHAIAPYGPLTYYLPGALGRVAGGEAPTPRFIYRVGRAQSFAAVFGISCLIISLVRRRGLGIGWGVAGAAAFLSWERLCTFSVSYRPDGPQVFFALLAIWIADGGEARPRRALAALACVAGSMWFKPASWAALLAVGFWIYRSRGLRASAIWIGAFGALNLAAAVALNWMMEGRLFLNMVTALDNGLDPPNMLNFYRDMPWPTLLVVVWGLGASISAISRRGGETGVLEFSLAASFVISNLQALKYGADVNYLMEALALASAVALPRIAAFWQDASPRRAPLREAFLWLVVVPLALSDAYNGLKFIRTELEGVLSVDKTNKEMKALSFDGPILTFEPFLATCRPSPPTPMDLLHYINLVKRGYIDPSVLIGKLERREFSVVIVSVIIKAPDGLAWFHPDVQKALFKNYPRRTEIANVAFLEPAEPRR